VKKLRNSERPPERFEHALSDTAFERLLEFVQAEDESREDLRKRFENGDKNALIQAIRFFFNEKIVAPEWVVDAFFEAMNKWLSMEVKELGAAFGLTWPKGRSVAAAKKQRKVMFAVYLSIIKASENRAIDDGLFEEIGKRFSLGKTLVKKYYALAKKTLPIESQKRQRRKK
jgi:hypothetical protein